METNLSQIQPTVSVDVLGRAMGRALKVELQQGPTSQIASDLLGDTFHSLYRQPDLLDADRVGEERQVNRSVQNWFRNSSAWKPLTEQTSGSLPATLAALEATWQGLQSDEAIQEAMKQAEEAEQQEQQANDLDFQANVQDGAGDNASAAQMRQQAQALRQQAQAAYQAAAGQMDAMSGNKMSQAVMGQMLKGAAKDAQEINQVMGGWGLGAGSRVSSDPAQALEFMRKMDAKLKKIALLAGRARMIAGRAKSQSVTTRGRTPHGYTQTKNPALILPAELALLHTDAPEVLRKLQIAKYADGGLRGRKRIGRPDSQGPFVLALDGSGSMRGEPEIYAKGLGLGLAQHAQSDQRPYHLFTFSSRHDDYFACTSQDSWQQHLEWASKMQYGGTDFDKPLIDAIIYIQQLPDPSNADIVFISDGYASVGPATAQRWLDFKAQTGTRLLFLAVGFSPLPDLFALADKVIDVADLVSDFDNAAAQIGGW